MNLEKTTVNLPTMVAIITAAFGLYFFLGDTVEFAKIEAQIYAIDMDMERDQEVILMYQIQIENGIALPTTPGRMQALKDKIERRRLQKSELLR